MSLLPNKSDMMAVRRGADFVSDAGGAVTGGREFWKLCVTSRSANGKKRSGRPY